MIPLKNETTQLLIEKCYELIAQTSMELGLKTDGKTMAGLSTIIAKELIDKRQFNNMTFNQIQDAFHLGVRFGNFDPFLNIRTFYRWIIEHKKTIDDATYLVRTMGKDPKIVPYYQEQKLLK
jgi:hypothetical protein